MKKAFITIFLSALLFIPGVQAQEDIEEWMDYDAAYGEVVAIDTDARTITLLEEDFEEEKKVSVTYKIGEDVILEGFDDLSYISPGDWVDLEYHTDGEGNRIVDFIAAEIELLFEEEELEKAKEPIE